MDDAQLVEDILVNKTGAFDAVHRIYAPMVEAITRRRLRGEGWRDAAAETWAAVIADDFAILRQWKSSGSLTLAPLLSTVAHRKAIDSVRRTGSDSKLNAVFEEHLAALAKERPIDLDTRRVAAAALCEAAMERLEPREQTIARLTAAGLTDREIGAALDTPITDQSVRRLRRSFQERLRAEFDADTRREAGLRR